jgi:WD40 repeat protein
MLVRFSLTLAACLALVRGLTAGPPASGRNPDLPTQGSRKARTDALGDPLPEGALLRFGTTRLRHWGVHHLSFSADGAELASVGYTSELLVWDVKTGRLVRKHRLPGQTGFGDEVASPDGRFLAVLGGVEVLLLDRSNGKPLQRWANRGGWGSAAFTRDGKALVGLSGDGTVHRWALASGKKLSRRTFPLAEGHPLALLLPDGTTLAGTLQSDVEKSKGGVVLQFWDVVSGKDCRPPFALPTDPSRWFWSPDGRLWVTLSRSARVQLWDLVTGKEVLLRGRKGAWKAGTAETAAFSTDGKALVLGLAGEVSLWDLTTGELRWSRTVATWATGVGDEMSSVRTVAISPDGQTLAVGCSCGHIALLQTASGGEAGFSREHPGRFGGPLHFAPDGRTLLLQAGGILSRRDVRTGKELCRFPGADVAAWSPNGKWLALVGRTGKAKRLRFVDPDTGRERWGRPARHITWAPDGRTLATIETDDTVCVLDGSTGKELRRYRPSPAGTAGTNKGEPVSRPVALSPDLRFVAALTAGGRKSAELWDLSTGRRNWSWEIPEGWELGWQLHFLPGGARLLFQIHGAAHELGTACVLDAVAGKKLHDFRDLPGNFRTFSPDERYALFEGREQVDVREVETGRVLLALSHRSRRSHCFAFAPDGNALAYNPNEETVELREVLTGKLLGRLPQDRYFLEHLAFAPDGRSLAVASNDSTVLLWDVTGLALAPGELPPLRLTRADCARLWADLAGGDEKRLPRAFWTLAAGGKQSVAALRLQLRPVRSPDRKQVAALLADLGSGQFGRRERATRALQDMEGVRPALAKALAHPPSLEVRRRIEQILRALDEPERKANLLRALRAVQVLEQLGGPEARAL